MTRMLSFFAVLFLCCIASLALGAEHGPAVWEPVVEIEEDVYTAPSPENGSGVMWCFGNSCLGRIGENVFASELLLIPEAKPLNNCRWNLLARDAQGWNRVFVEDKERTREPSPLAVFPDAKTVFVSANPTLSQDLNQYSGPARPEIFRFDLDKQGESTTAVPEILLPQWEGSPPFTEHSYRSFAGDGKNRELILFQNVGYTHAEWAFFDRDGNWSARGKLAWPWGAEYATPQPIRVCYPSVALVDRKAYLCGVSDIVEPNPQWAKFKEELTGQKWDYDFRRLFLTWSEDITSGEFQPWIEIASREATCGWITPCDLRVGPNGDVYVLWFERALDLRLRERFFPNEKQSESLNVAVVREGKIVRRFEIARTDEGEKKPVANWGRFQSGPDGRCRVVYFVSGTEAGKVGVPDRSVAENRLVEIGSDGMLGEPRTIPLEKPFSQFFTATPRNGSEPSLTLDLLGPVGNQVRYARIRIVPEL